MKNQRTKGDWFFLTVASSGAASLLFLLLYIVVNGVDFFGSIPFWQFIAGRIWQPLSEVGQFGIFPMLLGSFYVSILAIIFSFPLGVGCALFTSISLPHEGGRIFLSFLEILAGIPSVLFGFIGLMVLVKVFEKYGRLASGECVLAAALLLSIMILPFIVTNCVESMEESCSLYEGVSLDLGVSKWYTAAHLILPQSFRAFSVSLILAFSRAMGETMAVMMVMGNAPIMPTLLGKGESIPALIALEMGSAEYGSRHYQALYAAGLVLLVALFLCNLLFYILRQRQRKEQSS